MKELPDGFSAVIKSTIVPGTTRTLVHDFPNLKIACSPEFLRAENANEDFRDQEVLVVGTIHEDLAETVFKHHIEAGILRQGKFFHTTATQAEIVKYVKNTFYGLKVIFGNHFQSLTNYFGEDWSKIKEIVTFPQERGIIDSHLDEFPEKRGFGGSCLPKDTRAIMMRFKELGIEAELFESLIRDNERLSNKGQ